MVRHLQDVNLTRMGSNIICVTKGTQWPAKQALLMTKKEVAGIQVFKPMAFPSSSRFLGYNLLISSKARQSNGKKRAMQRGIVATGKQTEIKIFCWAVLHVRASCQIKENILSIFHQHFQQEKQELNSELYHFHCELQLNITNFSLNFYSITCPS